ncbi:MFS transporter [Dactylosporangium sp. NPDC049140]|uniref:MFS transporter n=1 Tax=Dactylosporangium sp. NPDC049140 TaxID=3155647 RepID=UPI0033DBB6E3
MTTAALPRPRTRSVLAGISLGYFMVLLDMTVLAVAEPDLATSLHASTAGLQWATTAYTVAFAALLLSSGALTDRYGASRLFHAGVAAFTVASLLSTLAPSLSVLIALRALMGIAAAACVPASMALIAALYPAPAARARAIATWAATSGAAVATGPIAGGALVGIAGWRAAFLINVPIGLLVLFLTRIAALARATTTAATRGHVPATTAEHRDRSPAPTRDRDSAPTRIDWPAQLAAAAVLASATDALIAAGARQWHHTIAATAVTAASLVVFIALERRSTAPVLNRALLRVRRVRSALLAGAAINFALSGLLFVLPLYLQRQHHLTALQTGLAFLPLTIPFVANPPITGRIVVRTGPHRPIVLGLTLLVAGGAGLAATTHAGSNSAWLGLALLITGLGVSFALPALAAAIVAAAPPGTTGAAAGVLNAVRQAGATAGVAVMGAAMSGGIARSLLLVSAVSVVALAVVMRAAR